MEDAGRELVFPTVEDIVAVNRRMIEQFGGRFSGEDNLRNRSALEYILSSMSGAVYDVELYPSLEEKAAALAHCIIAEHVFWDGCKRTGIAACRIFLRANGRDVPMDRSVERLALAVAAGGAGFPELLAWLRGEA